ncbi:MAG: outer membrane protein transport protein [Deltaproteobacteria bacterium]|nr:outer membrane protein transport protein [Deltaproteobacteria bacterium]
MKIRLGLVLGCLAAQPVAAGGLFLPGSGAISTSRAGAAVASTDDGEALAVNPSGMANTKGTTITLSAAIISYSMQFTRRGTYDNIASEDPSYEGQPFGTIKNNSKPPLGIGSFQPIPVIAVVTDLGGRLGPVRLGIGLYAPNAYPFRDMSGGYVFNGDFDAPPPPSRYDVVEQEGTILLPSIAASWRVSPMLDVGARFSFGSADIKTTTTVWGTPGNVTEFVKSDSLFTLEAKDSFVPAWGIGATVHATPYLDIAATYNSQITVRANGTATSQKGPDVNVNMQPIEIGKSLTPRCDPNTLPVGDESDFTSQRGCVDFATPMSLLVGARYKFLDGAGKMKGDIEFNAGWENWSADLATNYRVVVDSDVYIDGTSFLSLKDNVIRHEFSDTFSFRLGGSYHLPVGDNTVILRAGVSHDTRAAKEGWLRASLDGAARTMMALGGAYRAKRFEIDAGFGFVYEGTQNNPGECNVLVDTPDMKGCNNDGNERASKDRIGLDPINPLVVTEQQTESPVTLGEYKSHYVMFMLGASTWF